MEHSKANRVTSQALMSQNLVTVSPIQPTDLTSELKIFSAKAKALYTYEGGNEDDMPFSEGDVLNIVDHSEGDWWKTEQNGIIFIVPAAYLELLDG
jgi:hypothetical protein